MATPAPAPAPPPVLEKKSSYTTRKAVATPAPAPAPAPPPVLEKKSSYTTRTPAAVPVEDPVPRVPTSPPAKKKNGNIGAADESVTNAIELIKKMKKEAKGPKKAKEPKKSSGGGGGGGLGDMLGALPSSKKFKKQQKKANPMSSSMSVPAVPTQGSIRQRNFDTPAPRPSSPAVEEAPTSPEAMQDDSTNSKKSSRGPSSSIKNRMSMFGGKGGGGMSFPSDTRFKPPSFTNRTKRTSETKSPSLKPNTIAVALKRTSNGTSSRKLMEDDSYKSAGSNHHDPMSQSDKSHDHSRDKQDLMAGMEQRPVRRNSFDNKKSGGGRSSLRDRMKLFEQNIQKNQQKGAVKKIY